MDDRSVYEAPALAEIGTLHDITLLTIGKTGTNPDALSGITIGNTTIGPGSNVVITP